MQHASSVSEQLDAMRAQRTAALQADQLQALRQQRFAQLEREVAVIARNPTLGVNMAGQLRDAAVSARSLAGYGTWAAGPQRMREAGRLVGRPAPYPPRRQQGQQAAPVQRKEEPSRRQQEEQADAPPPPPSQPPGALFAAAAGLLSLSPQNSPVLRPVNPTLPLPYSPPLSSSMVAGELIDLLGTPEILGIAREHGKPDAESSSSMWMLSARAPAAPPMPSPSLVSASSPSTATAWSPSVSPTPATPNVLEQAKAAWHSESGSAERDGGCSMLHSNAAGMKRAPSLMDVLSGR